MRTQMTIQEATEILNTTTIVEKCGRKIAASSEIVARIAKQGRDGIEGGDFTIYEDVYIGGIAYSFGNEREMWDILEAARLLAPAAPDAPAPAAPDAPAPAAPDAPAPAAPANLPAVITASRAVTPEKLETTCRGQLWEECPTCGAAPVCAGCGYCARHGNCGGAPESTVSGEIYGGQN